LNFSDNSDPKSISPGIVPPGQPLFYGEKSCLIFLF
jgi:hypothetical protein